MISRNQVFCFQKRKILGAPTHKDFIFLENFAVFSLAMSITKWKIFCSLLCCSAPIKETGKPCFLKHVEMRSFYIFHNIFWENINNSHNFLWALLYKTHIYIKFQRKMINSSWVGTPRTFPFFKEKTKFLANNKFNLKLSAELSIEPIQLEKKLSV